MIRDLIIELYGETVYNILAVFFNLYPIWLPILLGVLFWNLWVRYVQGAYNAGLPRILLEIVPPQEQTRSPLAMELVLGALYQGHRESTYFSKYWKGSTRPWFSLEIVSLGGDVHFYIWTEAYMKNVIEAEIYSQYPGAEVHQVDDYVQGFDFDPSKNDVWGMQYEFINAAPYPIKSYVDYGLDRESEEETKVDPMSSMIEFWGGIKKEEQIWFQMVIRGHKEEKRFGFFSPKTDWRKDTKDEIKKIYQGAAKESKEIGEQVRSRLTKGEQDKIAAMERNIAKFGFDTGIRALYVAPKEVFSKDTTSGVGATVRHYNNNMFNGFKNGYETDFTKLPWEDFNEIRVTRRKYEMVDAYKRRGWFFPPHVHPSLTMSVEELATMFHLPGLIVQAPKMQRVSSKKGQAPANLPL